MGEKSSESLRQAMKISRRDWESLTLWDRRHIGLVIFWFATKNKIKKFSRDLIVQVKAFLQQRFTMRSRQNKVTREDGEPFDIDAVIEWERFEAAWTKLTYWQRKRIYYLARWYEIKRTSKKYFTTLIVQVKAFLQQRSI